MKIELTVPERWNQLDAKQLLFVSNLFCSNLSDLEIKTIAFKRFTGLKPIVSTGGNAILYTHKKYKEPFELSSEEIAWFVQNNMQFLTQEITEIAPLQKLKGYTHVDARLRGAPFHQYIACENYYQAFLHTKKENFLNCLAACFYTDGKNFSDSITPQKSKRFASLKKAERYTVFLWYAGLKTVFMQHFPNFFVQVQPDEDNEKEPAPINMREHINNMIRNLHGGDVTKTQAVLNTEVWTALAELDAKALEAKETRKYIDRLKRKAP